jgi:hypothetical protein
LLPAAPARDIEKVRTLGRELLRHCRDTTFETTQANLIPFVYCPTSSPAIDRRKR